MTDWYRVHYPALRKGVQSIIGNELVVCARLAGEGKAFGSKVESGGNAYALLMASSDHHRALAELHSQGLYEAWWELLDDEANPFVSVGRALVPRAKLKAQHLEAIALVATHASIKRQGKAPAAAKKRGLTKAQKSVLSTMVALDGGYLDQDNGYNPRVLSTLAERGLVRHVGEGLWALTLRGLVESRK